MTSPIHYDHARTQSVKLVTLKIFILKIKHILRLKKDDARAIFIYRENMGIWSISQQENEVLYTLIFIV